MFSQRVLQSVCVWFLLVGTAAAQLLPPAEAPIPAASREWTGADYEIVASALAQGRLDLPRFGAGEADALMRRLVSFENLRFQRNKKIPIEHRLSDFVRLNSATSQIVRHYGAAADRGANLHAELAALMAFLVRGAATGAELLTDWVAVMPQDDKLEIRMRGLDQVKSGITTLLISAELSLGEAMYDANDRSLILSAVADSILALEHLLADDAKRELRQKFETQRNKGTELDAENIRTILEGLD